jgi:hypothetical protein
VVGLFRVFYSFYPGREENKFESKILGVGVGEKLFFLMFFVTRKFICYTDVS